MRRFSEVFSKSERFKNAQSLDRITSAWTGAAWPTIRRPTPRNQTTTPTRVGTRRTWLPKTRSSSIQAMIDIAIEVGFASSLFVFVAGHDFIYWTAPEIVRSSVPFFLRKQSVVMNCQINPGLFL